MLDYLIIIQARLGSTRFPNKGMEMVGGVPMVKRVWMAAKRVQSVLKTCGETAHVVVAWPERYPDLDENNVLERFKRLSNEFPSKRIVRLTADCPLLTVHDIYGAVRSAVGIYFNNREDGHDVQVFRAEVLSKPNMTNKEHVIADSPNVGGMSVNTKADLAKVRSYAR